MRDYLQNHGLASSVDWSPTWSELQNKINSSYPVVLLTSLTKAGHYVLGIGYYSSQHTVVIHDPYGDKNQGYMNYNGTSVSYDWPGYNNGYSNLNTVHCFIYADNTGAVPTPTPTVSPTPVATAQITIQTNSEAFSASLDLSITVDGTSYTSPQTLSWSAGSTHTISVPTPQYSTDQMTRYNFSSWNDGGSQIHTITVPSSNGTYTATFKTEYQLDTTERYQ